jgi:Uma2 family endonuclease
VSIATLGERMNQPVFPPPESPPQPPLPVLAPEDYPNIDHLVFEDDLPVDSIFAEREQRLLIEPLYVSWKGPEDGGPFLAVSNVGLFNSVDEPPEVPDAMLSLGVRAGDDLHAKQHRSYLLWVLGKFPDVVVEIVSDKRGGEETRKLRRYARLGIPYYVIFDPRNLLAQGVLRAFLLRGRTYEAIDASWFPEVGLGMKLWEGEYEDCHATWLRWCDREGKVIATGKERVAEEHRRAEEAERQAAREKEQAERLRAKLRALGIDPDA